MVESISCPIKNKTLPLNFVINMHIQLSGENVEITPHLEQLVEEKLTKDLEKLLLDFAPDMKTARVKIAKRSRWGYQVNFDMFLPGKEHLYAEDVSEDLPSVLVKVREEVEHQLLRYKSKIGHGKKTIRGGFESPLVD